MHAGNLAVTEAGGAEQYYWEIYHVMGDPSLMPYIGSFRWYDPNLGWRYDNSVNQSNIDNFLFAASCCSMGATFKINWAK